MSRTQVEVLCVVVGYQRFEGPCCLRLQVEVFSFETPCSAVMGYHLFGGPCRLHLQVKVFYFVTALSVVGYQTFGGPCPIHLQGEDGLEY